MRSNQISFPHRDLSLRRDHGLCARPRGLISKNLAQQITPAFRPGSSNLRLAENSVPSEVRPLDGGGHKMFAFPAAGAHRSPGRSTGYQSLKESPARHAAGTSLSVQPQEGFHGSLNRSTAQL